MKNRHPEQQQDEIFLGNFKKESFDEIGWKTKRRGATAYLADGRLMDSYSAQVLKPVFCKRSEVAEAHASCADPFVRICYQNMLLNDRI